MQVRVLAEGYKIHFVPPDRTAIAFKTVLVGEETKEAVVLSNQGKSEGIAHVSASLTFASISWNHPLD